MWVILIILFMFVLGIKLGMDHVAWKMFKQGHFKASDYTNITSWKYFKDTLIELFLK